MTHFFIRFLIALVLAYTTCLAQDEPINRMGLGMSLDPLRIQNQSYVYYYSPAGQVYVAITTPLPVAFYLPINIAERFRIEPAFGISSGNEENTTQPTSPGFSASLASLKISVLAIGVRATYLIPLSPSTHLYAGPKIEARRISTTVEDTYTTGFPLPNTVFAYKTEIKETDVTAGVLFGAEYFPVHHFSIGGESSLNYTFFGNPDRTVTSTPPQTVSVSPERKKHEIRTDALLFVRWYFL